MTNVIKIEPVTRLEGHVDLTLKLNDDGTLDSVQLNVLSTRFFEKFAEGRYCEHIPRITPRICGICPIPHHLAPTKAVEDAWGVKITPTAEKLRRLMLNAKQYASHMLHFYALAAPDFLFGPFAPPEKRNVVAVINALPEVGKMALEMMDFGQKICAEIGGKAVHPIAAVIGGMRKSLSEERRDFFLQWADKQLESLTKTVDLGKKLTNDYMDVVQAAVCPTWYLGYVTPDEHVHEIYDGQLVFSSPEGEKLYYDVHNYVQCIGEHIVPHSYATHTYHKPTGYPDGIYRAGPLGMLNTCERMATPLAEEAFQDMKNVLTPPIHNTFAYHWARLIETVEALELIKQYLEDSEICNKDIKVDVTAREGEGVGVVEAPRGILLYNIKSDGDGICRGLNLIVATNHNMAGIEKSVEQVARAVLEGGLLDTLNLPEPMLK